MRVLVTGANGFVGSAMLVRIVTTAGLQAVGACRQPIGQPLPGASYTVVGDLAADTDWSKALSKVEVVIHTAARVHVMTETVDDPLTAFRRANVDGTLSLARQAVQAGVRRFIFISSIKVNGEETPLGRPYTAEDTPAPVDPYGVSKLEAETALLKLASETGLEVVIIRPPLIYGPGVKANFARMMRWLARGVPLPLGSINNRRSLVSLYNLVDLTACCISHPAAANQVFLVSDGEDLSTTELLKRLGLALSRPARLLPIPISLLKIVAALLGRGAMAQRLCGSLQVDIGKTREILAWQPPLAVDEGLRRVSRHFLENK